MSKVIKSKPVNKDDSKSTVKKIPVNSINAQNISGGVEFLEGKIIIPPKMPKSGPYFPDIYQPCKCEYCGREFTNFARRDYHVAHEHTNAGKENKANTDTNNKFFI